MPINSGIVPTDVKSDCVLSPVKCATEYGFSQNYNPSTSINQSFANKPKDLTSTLLEMNMKQMSMSSSSTGYSASSSASLHNSMSMPAIGKPNNSIGPQPNAMYMPSTGMSSIVSNNSFSKPLGQFNEAQRNPHMQATYSSGFGMSPHPTSISQSTTFSGLSPSVKKPPTSSNSSNNPILSKRDIEEFLK